jgi:hypothetical protein
MIVDAATGLAVLAARVDYESAAGYWVLDDE